MNPPERPAGLIAGHLEGMSFPDLIWALSELRVTGVLHIGCEGVRKKVYLDEGRITFASSSDPDDRLGEILLREGLIHLDHLEEAITKLYLGRRLGTLLVELGYLKADDLVRGVLTQVREIVLSLFTWEEGSYRFEEGPLPTQEVVTLDMKTGEILLQGVKHVRSFRRIRKSVGGPRRRYRLSENWRQATEGLTLGEGEKLILNRLEEGAETIEGLCRDLYLSNFEIYQTLWALRLLAAIRESEWTAEDPRGAGLEGRLDTEAFVDVLVRVCRSGETGVLHVVRGTIERSFHVEAGRCVFATSSDVEDGLIAHLFRRGVISLRHREDTARRLLSNKRVGTILLEMGVLSASDLREMVREQLSEILFDTFRWHGGEYFFVPGTLPTIEDIVLDRSIEDLVTDGLRRVKCWSRVREGCGGHRSLLALTPQYLDVLDRMKVGPEEWGIVSALRAPKTLHEICESAGLSEFRSAQILWALRVLGAVQQSPVEALEEILPGAAEQEDVPTQPSRASVPAEGAGAAWLADTIGVSEPESDLGPSEEPSAADAAGIDESLERLVAAPAEPVSIAPEPVHEPPLAGPYDESGSLELDSPGDATMAFSRDEVDARLESEAGDLEAPCFEVDASGAREPSPQLPPLEPAGVRPEIPGLDAEGARGAPESAGPDLEGPPEEEAVSPEPTVWGTTEPPSLSLDETEDTAQTSELSRAQVEAALRAEEDIGASSVRSTEAEPAPFPEPAEPAEGAVARAEESGGAEDALLGELDRRIAHFNACHQVLFKAIRSEVGAGSVNFVNACCGGVEKSYGTLFASRRLLPDGTWDPEALRKAALELRIAEPWSGFERLLEREIEMLSFQIGEARGKDLREKLAQVMASSSAEASSRDGGKEEPGA